VTHDAAIWGAEFVGDAVGAREFLSTLTQQRYTLAYPFNAHTYHL